MYKTLLQGGHFSHATRAVERAPRFDAADFAVRFVQRVGREVSVAMAQGDGAFVVAALCDQLAAAEGEDEALKEARAAVKGWFDAKTRKAVKGSGAKGAVVLLESDCWQMKIAAFVSAWTTRRRRRKWDSESVLTKRCRT